MGGRVTAVSLVTFLLLSMLSVSLPAATHLDVEQKSMETSSATITFSNGPVEDETVTGLKTVSFSLSGTGTIDSILVEIAKVGDAYTTLTNLTGRLGCSILIQTRTRMVHTHFELLDGILMQAIRL